MLRLTRNAASSLYPYSMLCHTHILLNMQKPNVNGITSCGKIIENKSPPIKFDTKCDAKCDDTLKSFIKKSLFRSKLDLVIGAIWLPVILGFYVLITISVYYVICINVNKFLYQEN